jgi:ComF family protein
MARFSQLLDKLCSYTAMRGMCADWMSGLRQAANALIFPWSCPLCGLAGINEPFCCSCRRELLEESATTAASSCPRCALPVGPFENVNGGCAACRDASFGFDESLALGPYDQALRNLCLQLKRERNAWLAPWVSDLLVEARGDSLRQLPRDTWIVPVPLHWWRYWCRGYNQAEALAHGMGQRLKLPVHRLLRRVVATPKLADLGRTERAAIMRRAFRAELSPGLTGRTVLLVDDVLTSGATCSAAATALKRAGALYVVVVVVARAVRKSLWA